MLEASAPLPVFLVAFYDYLAVHCIRKSVSVLINFNNRYPSHTVDNSQPFPLVTLLFLQTLQIDCLQFNGTAVLTNSEVSRRQLETGSKQIKKIKIPTVAFMG